MQTPAGVLAQDVMPCATMQLYPQAMFPEEILHSGLGKGR
jgi:hypothetical protein